MTARRIVSCCPHAGRPSTPVATVPAVGSQRRIQAMAWMRWPLAEQAKQAGIPPAEYAAVLTADRVDPLTAKKVDEVYGRLSMKFGPDLNAHQLALNNGWFPPLAWDDGDWTGWADEDCTIIGTWSGHDIDNPRAIPCVIPKVGKPKPEVPVDELLLQSLAAGHTIAPATKRDLGTRDQLMYRLSRSGVTNVALGEKFGLSRQAVSLITKPDSWRFYGE